MSEAAIPSYVSEPVARQRRRRQHSLAEAIDRLELLEQRVMLSDVPLVVGGTLSGDMNWTGTVHVTSDLIVAAGTRVFIDAGTVVKLNQAVSISVEGMLDALGSEVAPVVFTSSRDDSIGLDVTPGANTASRGGWDTIYFGNASDASQLRHVEVRHAGNSIQDRKSVV